MKLAINQSVTVDINSNEFWNDTQIEIQDGGEYKFEANGTWKDLFIKSEADGYSNAMNVFNKLKRSEENKWFSLMGSINKTDDFLIGKNNQMTFQKNGELYCYANDVKGFYWNNSGAVSLTITRIR